MSSRSYALDPAVGLADHRLIGASWEDLDTAGARAIGRTCVAVPSVRVGLSWTLGHLGLSRQQDHVLVPRWTSRCILTNLSRRALPTEEPTSRTRAIMVVHQYGLRQDMDAIAAECRSRGWHCLEDAAYGPDEEEGIAPGSVVRFIGLTKTLPVLRGALALSDDPALLETLRQRRSHASPWSLLVLGALSYLRAPSRSAQSSQLAEIAYEMYEPAGGADRWTRANILRGLERIERFASESKRRREEAVRALGSRLLVAERSHTPYVGMYFAPDLDGASAILRRHGFGPSPYHIDVARNLLRAEHRRAVLVPFNPRIPRADYEAVLMALKAVA